MLPSSEVVRLGKLFTRMIHCLGRFLIVLKRMRSAAIVRKFLSMKDATSNRRLLSQKINRVLGMIVRIQQAWRSAVVCKRAKMKVVMHMWDAEEKEWVRFRVLNGDHLVRSVQSQEHVVKAEETWRASFEREKEKEKREDKRDVSASRSEISRTSELDRRWKAMESKFKEFDNFQATSAKSLVLPKKVKVQFARNYVEVARKAHLTTAKDTLKEEVARLRLRVEFTTEDARQLLRGEEESGAILDRIRMQLVLKNMTSQRALNTYKHLKEEHRRMGRERPTADKATADEKGDGKGDQKGDIKGDSKGDGKGDDKVQFRIPLATFAFYQELRLPSSKERIRAAVRAAHNAC